MQTWQFTFNVGVNPGYDHKNEVENPLSIAAKVWSEEAEKVQTSGGFYVGAVANLSKTLYSKAFGCPEGGEDTVVFTGLLNPKFLDDKLKHLVSNVPNYGGKTAWWLAVQNVCRAVAKRLDQKTGYLSFSQIEFDYIQIGS